MSFMQTTVVKEMFNIIKDFGLAQKHPNKYVAYRSLDY